MPPVKSNNFHDVEIEQLARSWIVVSSNSIAGAGQKSDTFWTSIQNHFNRALDQFRERHPNVLASIFRTMRSLQSKWTAINRDCGKFSGCLSTIEALNESGKTDEEKLEDAKTLYIQRHKFGAAFEMIGCWEVLKENPKWQIANKQMEKHAQKRRRRKEPSATSGNDTDAGAAESNTATEEDLPHNGNGDARVGNKKAKEIAKLEQRSHQSSDGLAAAATDMAVAMNLRAEAITDASDNQLFLHDISRLDLESRAFIQEKRELARIRLQEKQFHLLGRRPPAVSPSPTPASTPASFPTADDSSPDDDDDGSQFETHSHALHPSRDSQPVNPPFAFMEAAEMYRSWNQ